MLQTLLSFQLVPIMSQDHTLHSVVMILLLLLIWNNFWVFLFLDTDIPEECRPIILYNNHQLWFVWCFFKLLAAIPQKYCCVLSHASLSESSCFQLDSQLTKLFFIMLLRWCLLCFSTVKLFYLLKLMNINHMWDILRLY